MIRFLVPSAVLAVAIVAVPAVAQTAPSPGAPPTSAPTASPAGATPTPGAVPMQSAAGATATPGKVAVGATVSDQAGAPVGTITQLTADAAVIDTGTVKAAVPLTAVGPGPNGGLVTTVTKVQLDSAAQQGAAQLKSMLVAGTAVHASDGSTTLGTVKEADDKLVTVTTDKGDIRLPVTAFGAQNGNFVTSLSADQFAAAVSQSLPAEKSTSTTTKTTAKSSTRSRRH